VPVAGWVAPCAVPLVARPELAEEEERRGWASLRRWLLRAAKPVEPEARPLVRVEWTRALVRPPVVTPVAAVVQPQESSLAGEPVPHRVSSKQP
jgi:hypothetical protein